MNILSQLQSLTKHKFISISTRGNTAINAAIALVPETTKTLIPEEGGWLSYKKIKNIEYVKCKDSVLDLKDLEKKLQKHDCGALLYQNPGGYFAPQQMKEIYALCKKNDCLVILDASGALGTKMCDGRFADVIVGSFGKWKLVEAQAGGFVSTNKKTLDDKMIVDELTDKKSLKVIEQKLVELRSRIDFLLTLRNKVVMDLQEFDIVHKESLGFVVVVKFKTDQEKSKIISYCKKNKLPFKECPRYIRLNKPAISIELKQLTE